MKDLKYLRLFDAYGALLTEHQRDICELYYMCDLSLTEIAEQKGISKQSVSDTLAKCRALLDGYEDKLRVVAMTQKISLYESGIAEARRCAEDFKSANPQYSGEADKVLKILEAVKK